MISKEEKSETTCDAILYLLEKKIEEVARYHQEAFWNPDNDKLSDMIAARLQISNNLSHISKLCEEYRTALYEHSNEDILSYKAAKSSAL